MLTVLWSTPRTGSTWYSQELYKKIQNNNRAAVYLRQYFSKHTLDCYFLPNQDMQVSKYEPKSFYLKYQLEPLCKKIVETRVYERKTISAQEEEVHRIHLLETTNITKYPIVLHQHVSPISIDTYHYLKNKANRNIYMYRENIVEQLASYVVAVYSNNFFQTNFQHIENAEIDLDRLESLYERILIWHKLDKTNCEIVKYEDVCDLKKNNKRPISQLSGKMLRAIQNLNERYQDFIFQFQKTI